MDIPRIKCLPQLLANQIAAGEVIEHPASVVKELLENAIDAGATDIEVSLVQGGLEKIIIRDNGCGIMADDLPLALTRHATSKLDKPTDLFAIKSMGFRGEALASIAAVAKLTLASRPKTQDEAWSLRWLNPAEAPECLPAAHPFGTSVTVAELFYNTPVRRKFLRSERTELLAIETSIKRLALAHPHIRFSLKHNDKVLLQLASAQTQIQRAQRVSQLLSTAFLQQAIYIDIHHQGLHLEGWLSTHTFHRNQHDWIYWAVNQRPVRDKVLLHAFKQVYAYSLPPDRYPACVLSLNLDPQLVDVNIHPTKHEVRFRESRLVHDFIVQALTAALAPEEGSETSHNHTETVFSATVPAYANEPTVNNIAPVYTAMVDTAFNAAINTPIAKTTYPSATRPTPKQIELQRQALQPLPRTPAEHVILHMHYMWLFDDNPLNQNKSVTVINIPKAIAWLAAKDTQQSKVLLFPVRISLVELPVIALADWQVKLSTLGIQTTLVSPQILLVNSLPELLHGIDIQQGLQHVFRKSTLLDNAECIRILCQHIDLAAFQSSTAAMNLYDNLKRFEALPGELMWQGEADRLYDKLFVIDSEFK